MLHAEISADGADGVRFGVVEGSPFAKFIFVVGPEEDLIEIAIGIELEEFLVVVIFAVDEGDEERAGIGAEKFGENIDFEIVLYFVASDRLGILEDVGIAAAGSGSAGFLEIVVGGIGETKQRAFEMFVELGSFSEVLETLAFGVRGRIEQEDAVADEGRAGYFVIDGSDKANRAGAEPEGAGIALEIVICDGDGFGGEREIAEGGVGGVGVCLRENVRREEKAGEQKARAARHEGSRRMT